VLALTYRSYRLNSDEDVDDDAEDTRVSQSSGEAAGDDEPSTPDVRRDTDEPDELDALPGYEGSR
jgi:multicomponent Na+:H+ antiporter subunit C